MQAPAFTIYTEPEDLNTQLSEQLSAQLYEGLIKDLGSKHAEALGFEPDEDLGSEPDEDLGFEPDEDLDTEPDEDLDTEPDEDPDTEPDEDLDQSYRPRFLPKDRVGKPQNLSEDSDSLKLFQLFFSVKEIENIVKQTNQQAAYINFKHPWKPLTVTETYRYLECLVYMGAQPLRD